MWQLGSSAIMCLGHLCRCWIPDDTTPWIEVLTHCELPTLISDDFAQDLRTFFLVSFYIGSQSFVQSTVFDFLGEITRASLAFFIETSSLGLTSW